MSVEDAAVVIVQLERERKREREKERETRETRDAREKVCIASARYMIFKYE